MLLAAFALAGCAHHQFFQPDARLPTAAGQPLPTGLDSVRDVTAGRQYAAHGRLYTAFFGRHHRQAWATPVTTAVFDLSTAVPGGLRPAKLGGGFNSTSLSLTDTAGQAYVLRTVDKDPARATPKSLRGTFLVNYLRDNVSATHPYAALVVPPLSEAVDVAHTTPRLFYVAANSPQLPGDSLQKLRGQIVLLEEKFSNRPYDSLDLIRGRSTYRSGLPTGTYSLLDSRKLFERVQRHSNFIVQPEAMLRARLLDAWLGDWDRHAGQWTWAQWKPSIRSAASRYSPVPKDRDMVFYRADDGVIPWLLTRPFTIRHWTTFKPQYTDPIGLMENGEFLDKRLLNSLTRQDFQRVATAMQAQLTDAVIAAALARLPTAVRAADGPALLAALQARRATLPAFADRFYRNLAHRVSIGGTNSEDKFEVWRSADSVKVEISSVKDGGIYFHRTFHRAETKAIDLEGLDDDDRLIMHESINHATGRPRLRFFGGPGHDEQQGKGRVRFRQDSRRPGRAYDKLPEE